MKEEKLVSIIMPAYNSSRFIKDSIESVLSQSYSNWELLVVDDCSTDDTALIVKWHEKKDKRVKYIKMEANTGSPSGPRNKGLEEARGEYIAFLDSDDLWKFQKLEKQIDFMVNNNYEFICSSYEIISEEGEKIGTYKPSESVDYEMMLKNNSVGCLTAVVKRSLIEGYSFPRCGHEDYALWLKLVKKTYKIYACCETLAAYRKVSNSVSSNKMKVFKFFWHIYRYEENLSILKTLYLCSRYFVNVLWFKYS
ncbi:glycosyltransferase [Vibrio cholerae]|uniref:Glycosyltransferase family 2 protein n=1 Tax=Vibrio cholerae TaxID=666 RepID=A0A5C9T2L2_VIBCL|nr:MULTISPECIES: glycosyltransferase family 2 protein [Vibrio]ELJ8549488.1 glycosyltransferase family 2 protein [Vibrio cholerae]ELY5189369.1 glycosyltransferase family 2 protein [Vibrio cholerae]ELY5289296.1 glycosyltransferase family 2 protein [Vibrio cholerae]MEB5526959.1 glycosyltransferase [Vibrio cholerae]RBM80599.1 glycosyltransferase family 2 protein [Vibrio paracholerae]